MAERCFGPVGRRLRLAAGLSSPAHAAYSLPYPPPHTRRPRLAPVPARVSTYHVLPPRPPAEAVAERSEEEDRPATLPSANIALMAPEGPTLELPAGGVGAKL